METRANFVVIGAFTLAVIAGAFLFVLWFTGAAKLNEHSTYRVVFTGSVSGLSNGALVLFNGLKVGEVSHIDFVREDPGRVVATIDVDARAPIKRDTRARLEMQGLTGGAAIALMGGAPDAPPLAARDGGPAVIVAEPSQFQNLLESVQAISARADSVLAKADKILTDNGPAIDSTLTNIATFAKALGDSSSGINVALTSLSDLGKKIGPLSNKLETLSGDVDELVKAVDPAKVRKVVDNAEAFSGTLADSKGSYQALLADASTLAKNLNETSKKLDAALADADGLIQAVDRRKIASVVDTVDDFTQTLRANKGNVDRMLKDFSELSAKLNDSADKIDGLIASAQNVIGSPDTKGSLAEVGDAAQSVKKLADDLNARTRDIAAGLSRFSNSGLREFEALAIDGRRALNDVDRLVRSLEKNPNQVIFGARPALPEYRGGP